MISQTIKLLTVCFALGLSQANFADTSLLEQEKNSTYLRFAINLAKDKVSISKNGQSLIFKTLDEQSYLQLKESFEASRLDTAYISGIKYLGMDSNNAFTITLELKDSQIETFNFYRDREKKHVVDLWFDGESTTLSKTPISQVIKKATEKIEREEKVVVSENTDDEVVETNSSTQKETGRIVKVLPRQIEAKAPKIEKKNPEKVVEKATLEEKAEKDDLLSKFLVNEKNRPQLSAEELAKIDEDSKKPYRDFRYGATFVWDYEPLAPTVKALVNIERKIPESYFPIENRKFQKNEKEAHLQLTINLYRQKKWGLMYKSIKLFNTKYGETSEWELHEYIKANAILRENIDNPNPETFKTAFTMLNNLSEKTLNYELKKAIWKYQISYYVDKTDYLKLLQIAKNFYASSRENFDFEESPYPAELMLYALSRMGQVEQIRELIQEKNIKKLVNAQTRLAYESFSALKRGQLEETVNLYEKNKDAFQKPVHPVILYNAAEGYFRLGKFQDAMSLFKSFVKDYAYEHVSANANLRIALASDFIDKNLKETLDYYKAAIDQTLDPMVSYEARIRYVALRSVRKKELSGEDREIRIFLDPEKNIDVSSDKNLARLLQQVRLRTLIVDGKYKEALSYLSVIPLVGMPKVEQRMFEGDGAEIVYGIMKEFYSKSEYAQVIKTWQLYKDRYFDKVANDMYINFIVGNAYLNLGLYKGFDEVYASFDKLSKTVSRTFPVWVERPVLNGPDALLAELAVVRDIRLGNWDLADKDLSKLNQKVPNYNKSNYYRGIISYNLKNYKASMNSFEDYIAKQEKKTIQDQSELAELFRDYTDSIFELGLKDKYLKVGEAVLSDTSSYGINHAYVQNVRERIAYQVIEILAEKKENTSDLERRIGEFNKKYPKSIYRYRMQYLSGQILLGNNKIDEAKQVFNNLLNDKESSNYIKELVKSELTLLKLKEKTL